MGKMIYQVSDVTLDTIRRQLFRHGQTVPISSRAFDILEYLVEKRGELVEKNALLEHVWSDSFVEESNLAVHVSALRRLLNEERGVPRFIKTIPGRGYSFIGPVREISATADPETATTKGPSPPVSIAVLPFELDGSDPDLQYIADGITQSLIDDLSVVPDLKVFAYSAVRAYRDARRDIQEIGFLLGARRILTGHILKYKDRLELRAELVNAADRSYIWGQTREFKGDDVFAVKREITFAIASGLKIKLTPAETSDISGPGEMGPAAQKLYFRGKFVLESRSFKEDVNSTLSQAINLFEQAIELEPRHSLAYTGLGAAYGALFNHRLMDRREALAKAHRALDKALEIDERLSQAHVLKGSTLILFERKFAEGEAALDRAIELNSNNADAYHWKSYSCMCRAQFEDAIAMELKAIEYDPVSIRYSGNIARLFYFSRQFDKAIIQAEEMLEFEKKDVACYLFLSLSCAHLGQFDEALSIYEKALECRNTSDIFLYKVDILARMERFDEAYGVIEQVLKKFPHEKMSYFALGVAYASLGENDKAFDALDTAIAEDDADLNVIKADHRFDNIRSDVRFDSILVRLGL